MRLPFASAVQRGVVRERSTRRAVQRVGTASALHSARLAGARPLVRARAALAAGERGASARARRHSRVQHVHAAARGKRGAGRVAARALSRRAPPRAPGGPRGPRGPAEGEAEGGRGVGGGDEGSYSTRTVGGWRWRWQWGRTPAAGGLTRRFSLLSPAEI